MKWNVTEWQVSWNSCNVLLFGVEHRVICWIYCLFKDKKSFLYIINISSGVISFRVWHINDWNIMHVTDIVILIYKPCITKWHKSVTGSIQDWMLNHLRWSNNVCCYWMWYSVYGWTMFNITFTLANYSAHRDHGIEVYMWHWMKRPSHMAVS